MDDELAPKAISAALAGNWEEALKINQAILSQQPDNLSALNRLAKAHLELGQITKARSAAKKVLAKDPKNKIATKTLEKTTKSTKTTTIKNTKKGTHQDPQAFLEEPGKTRLVNLINLGDKRVLANLDSGDEVALVAHKRRVSINNLDGNYVGRLPDDLAAHLRKLIRFGNEYSALIKSLENHKVQIFIREVKRGEKVKQVASFPTEKVSYVAFAPPELVSKKENLTYDEEEGS